MSPDLLIPVLAFAGSALLAIGTLIGAVLHHGVNRKRAETEALTAASVAEGNLVGQLQKELERYRDATDKRLEKLEQENTAYRRYVFDLIDHGTTHGITPLPWPSDIPR